MGGTEQAGRGRASAPLVAASVTADTAADDLRVERILMWLIVLPFTAPMWFSLRRERPDLAARTQWAMWLNIAQSLLFVALIGLLWWAFAELPRLVDMMVKSGLGS